MEISLLNKLCTKGNFMKHLRLLAVFVTSFFIFSGSILAGHCGGSHSATPKVKSETTASAANGIQDEADIEAPESADTLEKEQSEQPQSTEA